MALLWPKYGPHMGLKISYSHYNQCAKGGSMQTITFQGVFHSPLFQEMAKIWPFYGQNRVLTCSFKLVLPEYQSLCPNVFHAKCHFAGFILKPPFIEMAKIWPGMAKTWSSHG